MPTPGARRKSHPEPVASLTWAQAAAWRMRRQHLDRRVPGSAMLEVASRLCGLHAQLTSSAELTLWARVDDLLPNALARALWEERTLVKLWAMRGTLHIFPSAEYPLWQAALATYQHYFKPVWLRNFGVTREELERLLSAVSEALDGEAMTREELAAAVAGATGSEELGEKVRGSWGPFLKPGSFRGGLCFAPSLGQNVRFTRPDRWLGAWQPVEGSQAEREVLRRFLAAHGPATSEDFARWWGATPAHAGFLFQSLGEEVVPVQVEDDMAWMPADQVEDAAGAVPPGVVRLLPAFDHYVVSAGARLNRLMPGDFKDRVYRPQGWISPVLLVDGLVMGVWRHEKKGSRLLVRIEPFVKLAEWVREGAEEEAERLSRFLGGSLELSWGELNGGVS